MARWISVAWVALAVIPSVLAQEKAPAAAAGSRPDRLAAIQKEFDDARKAFSKAYQTAQTPEERGKLVRPDAKTFAPRVWELVREDPRDDTGFAALSWIVEVEPSRKDLSDAIAALAKDQVKNPKIGDVCTSLGRRIYVDSKLLERVVAENPDHAAQGQALYALASYRLDSARMPKSIASSSADDLKELKEYLGEERFAELKALDGDKAEKEATALLDRVVKDYADVKGSRSTLGEAAKADLFEIRELAVGKTVPEIEAEDLEGVSFKLSEYRGKVVLLDFWGNW